MNHRTATATALPPRHMPPQPTSSTHSGRAELSRALVHCVAGALRRLLAGPSVPPSSRELRSFRASLARVSRARRPAGRTGRYRPTTRHATVAENADILHSGHASDVGARVTTEVPARAGSEADEQDRLQATANSVGTEFRHRHARPTLVSIFSRLSSVTPTTRRAFAGCSRRSRRRVLTRRPRAQRRSSTHS